MASGSLAKSAGEPRGAQESRGVIATRVHSDQGAVSGAIVRHPDSPPATPNAPRSTRRGASHRVSSRRRKRHRADAVSRRGGSVGAIDGAGDPVKDPKLPGGVWRAEARLAIMELWLKFIDLNNSKPGAGLQLSLANAAKWVAAREEFTSVWGTIKSLAVKRVMESIKAHVQNRSHTPTGMGAAELIVHRENKDEVQAASWRMDWEQMRDLVEMATGVVGCTGQTMRSAAVTIGSPARRSRNAPSPLASTSGVTLQGPAAGAGVEPPRSPRASAAPAAVAPQRPNGDVTSPAACVPPCPRGAPATTAQVEASRSPRGSPVAVEPTGPRASPVNSRPATASESTSAGTGQTDQSCGSTSDAAGSCEAESSDGSPPRNTRQEPPPAQPNAAPGVIPPVLTPRPPVASNPAGVPRPRPADGTARTLPSSSKPGGASGRSRRPSAADREALAVLGGTEMIDFMRDSVRETNAAKEAESSAALESVRLQARVTERQAERQFELDERRENREREVAMRKVRIDEQRVAAELVHAKSVGVIKKLDTLKEL